MHSKNGNSDDKKILWCAWNVIYAYSRMAVDKMKSYFLFLKKIFGPGSPMNFS